MDCQTRLDLKGMRCPMPIVKISHGIESVAPGELLEAQADDPAFLPDVQAWCRRMRHELVETEKNETGTRVVIRRAA